MLVPSLVNNEPYREATTEERDAKQARRLEAMARMLKLAGYSVASPPPQLTAQ
jgi:hypothetical protein